MKEPIFQTRTINNYDLKYPYHWKNGQQIENTDKYNFLVLVHYPSGKHYLFTTIETEKDLLKRVNYICFNNREPILYLNVYMFENNKFEIRNHYGEFTYKGLERQIDYSL